MNHDKWFVLFIYPYILFNIIRLCSNMNMILRLKKSDMPFPLAYYSNHIGPTAFLAKMIHNDYVQANLKLDP